MNRIIHTNLYSDKAFDVISDLIEVCRIWTHGKTNRSISKEWFDVKRECDGEVVFDIKDTDSWSFRRSAFYSRSSTNDALTWLALIFKNEIYNQFRRNDIKPQDRWVRDSSEFLEFQKSYYDKGNKTYGFSIQAVYCIYDIFKNRKNLRAKYPAGLIDSFKGQAKDPIATELEAARREEIAKLKAEYDSKCKDLQNEYWQKRREAENKIADWKKEADLMLKAEYDNKINEVNTMAMLTM